MRLAVFLGILFLFTFVVGGKKKEKKSKIDFDHVGTTEEIVKQLHLKEVTDKVVEPTSAPRRNLQQLDSGLDFLAGEEIANLLWSQSISDSGSVDDYETIPDYSLLPVDDYDDDDDYYNYENYLDYDADYFSNDYNFRSDYNYFDASDSDLNEVDDDAKVVQEDSSDGEYLDGISEQLDDSVLPVNFNQMDEIEEMIPEVELKNDLLDKLEHVQVDLDSSEVVDSPLSEKYTLQNDRTQQENFNTADNEPFYSAELGQKVQEISSEDLSTDFDYNKAEYIDDDGDQDLQRPSTDLGSEEFLDYDDHRLMWDFYRRLQEGYEDMLQDYIDANTDEEATEATKPQVENIGTLDQISEQNYISFEQAQRLQNEYNARLAEQEQEAENEPIATNPDDQTENFETESQTDLYNMIENEIQKKLLEELQSRIETSETDENNQVGVEFASELRDAILEEIEQRLFSDAQLAEGNEGRQLTENEDKGTEVNDENEELAETEIKESNDQKDQEDREKEDSEDHKREDQEEDYEDYDDEDYDDDDEDYGNEDYEDEDYDDEKDEDEDKKDRDQEDEDEDRDQEDQNQDQEVEDQDQKDEDQDADHEDQDAEDQDKDSKKDADAENISSDREDHDLNKYMPDLEPERIPGNDYDYFNIPEPDIEIEFETEDYQPFVDGNKFGFWGLDMIPGLNQQPGDIRIKIEVEYLNNYAEERKVEHRGALQRYVKEEFNNFVDNKFKHATEKLKNELKNSVQDHYVEFEGGFGKLVDTMKFESRIDDILEDLNDDFKTKMTSTINKYEQFGNEFEHFMNKEHEKQLMEQDMYQHVSEMLGLMKYQCSVKDICSTSLECGEGCGCTAGACFCCQVAPTDYLF